MMLFLKAVSHWDHLNIFYGCIRWHFVGIIPPKPDLKGAAHAAVDTVHEALWLLFLQASPSESW